MKKETKASRDQKVTTSFHRRSLPLTCVDFASAEGKAIFRDALDSGYMESYFPLAAQFHTQNEPAYCGPGTLSMVLNALNIDPGRTWKGVWRWFAEDLLDCCKPLEIVKKEGINFAEFVCLAKCNSAHVEPVLGSQSSLSEFRETVKESTSSSDNFLVVSYNRKKLSQTGSGHYSPIGGYCPDRDMVLILDVARFKYPPHWVPLPLMFEAMQDIDQDTGKSRGFISLSTKHSRLIPSVICHMLPHCTDECAITPTEAGEALRDLFGAVRATLREAKDIKELLDNIIQEIMRSTAKHIFHTVELSGLSSSYRLIVDGLKDEIRQSRFSKPVCDIISKDQSILERGFSCDTLIAILYSIPLDKLATGECTATMLDELQNAFDEMRATSYLSGEIHMLRSGMEALVDFYTQEDDKSPRKKGCLCASGKTCH